MKVNELFETTAAGAVGGGAVAGFRDRMFTRSRFLRPRSKVGKVPVIKYKHRNNWNLRDKDK